MATYTTSARINKAFETCDRYYTGMGAVNSKSKRFKIRFYLRDNKVTMWLLRKG